MMKHAGSGFIIPLTLMLISIATILITLLYQRGSIFVPFITTMYQREQAKMLALSGVQIGMSELAQQKLKNEKNTSKKEKKPSESLSTQEKTTFFTHIFPKINQWQEFKLTQDVDGINGMIKIFFASEDGKINLNTIYDIAKKKFLGEGQLQGDWKKIMQELLARLQKKMGISRNLFEEFEKFLKQRQYRVNDASELLTLEAFRPFVTRQFYEPAAKEKEPALYLMDLFTVYGYGKLQPWLLSDSIRSLLDMKKTPASSESIKRGAQELYKNFKPQFSVSQDWNTLFRPIYGIDFQRLPKGMDAVFETTFDPQLFSVVSYGIVGEITMCVYAILERVQRVAKQKVWYDVKIKKFYWI